MSTELKTNQNWRAREKIQTEFLYPKNRQIFMTSMSNQLVFELFVIEKYTDCSQGANKNIMGDYH